MISRTVCFPSFGFAPSETTIIVKLRPNASLCLIFSTSCGSKIEVVQESVQDDE